MTFDPKRHDHYSDDLIRSIMRETKTIALVGASNNDSRPSWIVMKYLKERGYTIYPVNPGLAGQEILGLPVYASLKDVPQPVDMVEIFRNSQAASFRFTVNGGRGNIPHRLIFVTASRTRPPKPIIARCFMSDGILARPISSRRCEINLVWSDRPGRSSASGCPCRS